MDTKRPFGRQISNIVYNPRQRLSSFTRYEKISIGDVKRSLDFKNISSNPNESRDSSITVRPSKQQKSIKDNNTQYVPEYFFTCLQFMLKKQMVPISNYFSHQNDLNKNMRQILIDWILDIHSKMKMFPQTLFMTVSLIDRYLSKEHDVSRSQLQLVGTAAFFIASKFEETYQVPNLAELVTFTARAYTKQEIMNMESKILKALEFNIITDSSFRFFEPLARLENMDDKNFNFCRYILELALYDIELMRFKQSMLASAVIYLVNKIRKKPVVWSQQMQSCTGYSEIQIKSCAKQLCIMLENAQNMVNLKCIKRKFSSKEYHEVTRIKLQKREKTERQFN